MKNNLQKQKCWNALIEKARGTGDRLGMGIDEGILLVVVGLWAHGIQTTGSCEGHADHGETYPWIRIGIFPPVEWGEMKLWWNDKDKQKYLSRKNKPILFKLFGLLKDFYADKKVPYEDQLIIAGVNGYSGESRLQSLEADWTFLFSKAEYRKRAAVHKKEMRRFGDFLRERFMKDAAT